MDCKSVCGPHSLSPPRPVTPPPALGPSDPPVVYISSPSVLLSSHDPARQSGRGLRGEGRDVTHAAVSQQED